MKTILRKINCLILCTVLVCFVPSVGAAAVFNIPGSCQVQADGGALYIVKTLDCDYANNTYLSLRDLAMVLKDTGKSFSLEITKNAVALNPGEDYVPLGTENTPWGEEEIPDTSIRRNEFRVSGETVSYYTLIAMLPSGSYDCFLMAADLAMILDADITLSGTGIGLGTGTEPGTGTWSGAKPETGTGLGTGSGSMVRVLEFHTQEPFRISPAVLEETGYFYGVNSVLVGDAVTGEVYYSYQADTSFPIASTSKLMTCLLALEAVSAGQLSLEELVTVSETAQLLSESSDGVIPMEAGQQITVKDLLTGALLPSSNECALCLAEAVAGSEEAFVERMNGKAAELGLSRAVFFNSNGLPVYTEAAVPAKLQNRMSAEDMFRLVSYLLRVYPQITDITSRQSAVLESLGQEVRNTNPLLRNMPQVTGLKTGTTNKAGACLVTSLSADDGTMEHELVVIVLGTEDSIERGRVSGLLAKYALDVFYSGMEDTGTGTAGNPGNLPTNAEAAVDRILDTAKRH